MEVPSFNEIFQQIRKNIIWCGIPLDNSRLRFLYFIEYIFLTLMIIEEASYLVTKASSENFLVLTGLAPCTCIGARSVLKFTSITLKRQKIFKLMDSLENLYTEIINDNTRRNLLCSEIIRVKSLTKYYFVLNLLLISVYNFSPLLIIAYDYFSKGEIELILPYPVSVPFSTDVFLNWLVVFLHSISCGFICVLYFTTVDALYCNLSAQVCANFASISHDIGNLNPSNSECLPQIVKRHQYIQKLSEELEEIFTASNFFNILVGSIEICALGFNITFGAWTEMPGLLLFLSSELLQILVMSVFGENIMRESSKVGDAAFSCDWYNMDKSSKKIILGIMIRTQKPQQLTALKFSTICYQSFTKIMSTSYSYFTILKTVYAPEVQ